MRKTIFKYFYFVSMAVLAVFLSNHFFSASAYEEPANSPPSSSIGSPIFSSALEQTKSGALGVNGLLDIGNDLIVDNKLGIKTDANTFALEVGGALKLAESNYTSEGLIKYSSVFGDDFCVHDGTIWTSLTGKTACTYCGDGEIGAGEECDNGASNGTACTPPNPCNDSCTYCDSNCQNVVVNAPDCCGNGTIEATEGEECDNGINNGAACTPPCGDTCHYCDTNCQNVTLTGGACCSPTTCAAHPTWCGIHDDGCGSNINCGGCSDDHQACDGGVCKDCSLQNCYCSEYGPSYGNIICSGGCKTAGGVGCGCEACEANSWGGAGCIDDHVPGCTCSTVGEACSANPGGCCSGSHCGGTGVCISDL